jgi:hypothetical protein
VAEYNQKFDDSNRGTLFRDEKTPRDAHGVKVNEKDRDASGSINIVCPHCQRPSDHWLSGWINIAKTSGKKFTSLRAKWKDGTDARPGVPAPKPKPVPLKQEMDDEIPF